MFAAIARILMLYALVFGILAPKMSAVIVQLVPGIQTLVICTGNGLVTLTIDADGEPVEMPRAEVDHCTMVDANSLDASFIPPWRAFTGDHTRLFTIKLHPSPDDHRFNQIPPSQAPPVLI